MVMKLSSQGYQLRVRVPSALRPLYGSRHIDHDLATTDAGTAATRAAVLAALLKADFSERAQGAAGIAASLAQIYQATLTPFGAKAPGSHVRQTPSPPLSSALPAPSLCRAARPGTARRRQSEGANARPEAPQSVQEPPFSHVATAYMLQWRARPGRKPSNTENQKQACFRLFAGFWADQPMRTIRDRDAAAFHDAIRLLDPHWARGPTAQSLSWGELMARFGGRESGLSDGTINRHLATLKTLWDWARKRGHCDGSNPFAGFHCKLRAGVNVSPYVAWEADELNVLMADPPRRRDLLELIVVGLHTGMRLDEIASLTWGQVRCAEGVPYFQVRDAKTPAGNRQVPVHPALSWLLARQIGDDTMRVWPAFNPEGPGKKAGADAGREFSRFKAARGFHSRTKAFHSFRKCVTRIMERAGVRENEWAQVLGHERGFTYRVYNPDGVTLARKAEIIALISYPDVRMPVWNTHPVTKPHADGGTRPNSHQ